MGREDEIIASLPEHLRTSILVLWGDPDNPKYRLRVARGAYRSKPLTLLIELELVEDVAPSEDSFEIYDLSALGRQVLSALREYLQGARSSGWET